MVPSFSFVFCFRVRLGNLFVTSQSLLCDEAHKRGDLRSALERRVDVTRDLRQGYQRPHQKDYIITARIRRMGKVMFSVCLSITPWGGEGGSPSPAHNTSTGPMSFQGVPHLHWRVLPLVPCPFCGEYPSPRQNGDTP